MAGGSESSDDNDKGAIGNNNMTDAELNFHKDSRKYLRSKITRKCNTIKTNIDSLDIHECHKEIDELQSLSDRLEKLNEKISGGLWIYVKDRAVLNQELD